MAIRLLDRETASIFILLIRIALQTEHYLL